MSFSDILNPTGIANLTATKMSGAINSPLTKAILGAPSVDNEFLYGSSSSYVIVNDTFKINLQKGATYSFASESYYDPYNIVVYDSVGTPLVENSEGNDSVNADVITGYIATYTGTHYISANWNRGFISAQQKIYFYASEDVDTMPINNAPLITSGSTGKVAENAPITTVIYDANATDVDTGTTLSYSLSGTDMSLLNINTTNGMVTLKTSANYEAKNSYNFNVSASDGRLSATKAVVVAVTNVYELGDAIPTAQAHLSTYGVTIQQAQNYIVANLTSPSTIYNTCLQFNVSNKMIVEIFDNAYSIDTVKGFFSANGLNPVSLDMYG